MLVSNGILNANGASTYAGGTTLSNGTVRVGISSASSTGPLGTGTLTLNGGTLQDNGSPSTPITLGNSVSLNGTVTLSSGPNGGGGLTFNGTGATVNIAGTSSLTVNTPTTISDVITGSSNLTIGTTGTGSLILGSANPYSGAMTINSGVVQLNNTNALQNSVVTLNTSGGLTFQAGIGSVALGGLSGSTNLTMTDLTNPTPAAVALTLGNSNSVGSSSASYSGNLTGSTLTKVGTNIQTLSGSNTFTGVTVANGILAVGGNSATPTPLGTAPVLLSGGVLRIIPPISTVTNSGFGGTSNSATGGGTTWIVNNSNIAGNPINSDVLTLTTANGGEARSAFYNSPVNYSGGFTAQFNYTETGGGTTPADGFAFMLQNSTAGTAALGGGGGNIGYTGITPSAAVQFEIYNGGPGYFGKTGFGTNGNLSEPNTSTAVNMNSGDPITVTVTYTPGSGGTISETLLDTVTLATQTFNYTNENLSSILGNSGNAIMGFSAGTGGADSNQTISQFSYASISLPAVPFLSPTT